MKLKETALGIFVIGVVVVMITPPPAWLMDFFLMLNIALSMFIMLDALYSKEPLDMSLFPTILLITTLFRLALNLSSTRLMLGKG
jgi:flagellar biosynthesis protein FlhA